MEVNAQQWQPDSWRRYPVTHQPPYRDNQQLKDISRIIANYPPLIPFTEIQRLQTQLLEVVAGRAFILQGGGCAELFTDCRADKITAELALLKQMAECIATHSGQSVITIGRIAGQYAKARSQSFEIVDGHKVITFRGDNINSRHPQQRTTDPVRLQQGYLHAAATMNFIRAQQQNFYISHEGLVLTYEQAMTRKVSSGYYNGGAHLLWIGDRTRDAKQGHVEYCRGIANPIAIKLGPTATPPKLLQILNLLNPTNDRAKIVLICRFGVDGVSHCLPKFIKTVNDHQLNVIWSVDPMHGNTRRLGSSMLLKTRLFSDIAQEIADSITIHRQYNSRLQGIHLELTSEPVTECLGGSQQLTEKNLADNYRTACDPRLNYQQSLEIANQLATALI